MAADTKGDGADARAVDRLDTELVLRGFRRLQDDKGVAWSRDRAPRMTVRLRSTKAGARITLQSPDLGSLKLDRQQIADPAGLLRTIDAWQRAARDGGDLPLAPPEPRTQPPDIAPVAPVAPGDSSQSVTPGPTPPQPAVVEGAPSTPAPPAAPVPVDPSQGASDVALVPLDAWDKVLGQLGNLYEAGQEAASARERAAKAETQAEFLKERLAEVRRGADEAMAELEQRLETARAAEQAALQRAAAAESDLYALRREGVSSGDAAQAPVDDRTRSYWWRRRRPDRS